MPAAAFLKSRAAFCGGIFALGFLLSGLTLAISPPAIPNPDEVFQGLEAGHRLAFGYGLVPWEFDYGARSWALGFLAAIPMSLASLFDLGPAFYLPLTWAFFSLGAGVTSLCAGLWGARFYGRWGGLAVALVAASWIDNLYFGGRSLSEVAGAHLLIAAVWLAEPGYRVESRNRLLAAGLIAALASMLRMQLGPVALLLWLWRWRDPRRFLLLSLGALAGLALTGLFDALTWDYPFEPIWQNTRFNLVLDGASTFGVDPWWWYFAEAWRRWGLLTLPFMLLALAGARRLPILAAMTLLVIAIHAAIPHKEYRFILPAVMMASILCGMGTMEAARGAARLLQGRLHAAAATAGAVLVGLLWLLVIAGNLGALAYDAAWQENSSILQMVLEMSRKPELCGIGFANMSPYSTGGYTFLHRPVPLYFDGNDLNRADNFAAVAGAYNALVVRRDTLDYFAGVPAYRDYALDHCAENHCLLIRPGACSDARPPRPAVGALNTALPRDRLYPYAAGISP
jgi:hypothetical protein